LGAPDPAGWVLNSKYSSLAFGRIQSNQIFCAQSTQKILIR